MRTYLFEYKNDDDPDYPEHTKFYDEFNSYLEEGEGDIDEFAREARQFLSARGYSPFNVTGLVYIRWRYGVNPNYNDEYLLTIKGSEYSTVDYWEDDHWKNHSADEVIAWADVPIGVTK